MNSLCYVTWCYFNIKCGSYVRGTSSHSVVFASSWNWTFCKPTKDISVHLKRQFNGPKIAKCVDWHRVTQWRSVLTDTVWHNGEVCWLTLCDTIAKCVDWHRVTQRRCVSVHIHSVLHFKLENYSFCHRQPKQLDEKWVVWQNFLAPSTWRAAQFCYLSLCSR